MKRMALMEIMVQVVKYARERNMIERMVSIGIQFLLCAGQQRSKTRVNRFGGGSSSNETELGTKALGRHPSTKDSFFLADVEFLAAALSNLNKNIMASSLIFGYFFFMASLSKRSALS